MNHQFYGRYKDIELRPLNKGDIEKLRQWRNDSVSTRFLRQVGHITQEMQEKWYKGYLEDNDIFAFAIVEKTKLKRMIGSVAIYNFRGNRAEIGKIQIGDSAAHGMGYGKIALVIVMKIGFELMSLDTIDGAVHQENIPAHKNDIVVGFQIVGSKPSEVGGLEDIIEINYESLKMANKYIDEIEVFKA